MVAILVRLWSDATTSTLLFSPDLTASMAAMDAVVPAFRHALKSAAPMPSSLTFRAAATIPAFNLSAKGRVVEARYTPSTFFLSLPAMQS
ncbi:MAG: hypothetical protein BWZ01_02676 [Deltaproteobacteria bacterium ADurb.BinA179]|nr:MAG: hypothetical protein BWZ01_02676 [Deltaproteobacteria bacterium ADurb.BinA179]